MPKIATKQTLLIDADDTLWENNIYFERAISAFTTYLNHPTLSPREIRTTLNGIEHEHVLEHGYGLGSFTRSLKVCFERLSATPLAAEHHTRIDGFVRSIAEHPIELLPGVAETLKELSTRHKLILMTKGNHGEQTNKLTRSGLERFFSAVEVVAEKDPQTYAEVIDRHQIDTAQAWMIGNSPKSDINPALASGLNAIFLFHKDTWVLEHAEISSPQPDRQLLELDGFAHLAEHF